MRCKGRPPASRSRGITGSSRVCSRSGSFGRRARRPDRADALARGARRRAIVPVRDRPGFGPRVDPTRAARDATTTAAAVRARVGVSRGPGGRRGATGSSAADAAAADAGDRGGAPRRPRVHPGEGRGRRGGGGRPAAPDGDPGRGRRRPGGDARPRAGGGDDRALASRVHRPPMVQRGPTRRGSVRVPIRLDGLAGGSATWGRSSARRSRAAAGSPRGPRVRVRGA